MKKIKNVESILIFAVRGSDFFSVHGREKPATTNDAVLLLGSVKKLETAKIVSGWTARN